MNMKILNSQREIENKTSWLVLQQNGVKTMCSWCYQSSQSPEFGVSFYQVTDKFNIILFYHSFIHNYLIEIPIFDIEWDDNVIFLAVSDAMGVK